MPSSIEWCQNPDGTPGEVWNPTVGCSRVSAGCEHCYAERMAHRGMAPQHRGLTTIGPSGHPRWTGEVRMLHDRLSIPLHWKKPRRIFVNSMSDLFHEKVPFEFIAAVFGVTAACPQHTFMILTKRDPRKWFDWVNSTNEPAGKLHNHLCDILQGPEDWDPDDSICQQLLDNAYDWPLSNVWLGVSCENQQTANQRIPWLLQLPAAVRFVSLEPLLGPVGLDNPHCSNCGILREEISSGPDCDAPWCMHCDSEASYGHWLDPCADPKQAGINWVIAGCESGPRARPMDEDWVRSIRDECQAEDVPFFFKQTVRDGKLVSTPELDGKVWAQFPRNNAVP